MEVEIGRKKKKSIPVFVEALALLKKKVGEFFNSITCFTFDCIHLKEVLGSVLVV